MKQKIVIFSAVVIVAVIAILFITKILPPVGKDQASGTIGKVDKYRKVQLTENDVLLRKELQTDTSSLAASIHGLVFFNAAVKQYTEDLKIFSAYLTENEQGLNQTKILNDYIGFLEDNSGTVENAMGLLVDVYHGDTTDYSVNTDKTLKEFDDFVKELIQRDNAVTAVLNELEGKINKKITSVSDKTEGINALINVHDQLLMRNFRVNYLLGNRSRVDSLLKRNVYNTLNAATLFSNEVNLKYVIENKEALKALNQEKLRDFMNMEKIGAAMNSAKLSADSKLGMGSSEKLGAVLNTEKLGMDAAGSLGPIRFSSGYQLDAYKIQAAGSQQLGAIESRSKLGPIAVANRVSTLGLFMYGNFKNTAVLQFGLFNTKQLNDKVNSYLNASMSVKMKESLGRGFILY